METNEEKYTFSQQTIRDYGSKTGSYLNEDLTIFKQNFTKHNEVKIFESKEPNQFLYMDVGRWGGDEPTGDAWTRMRNFGLVCGSGAILCNYNDLDTCGDPKLENISQDIKDNKDILKMINLLRKLSESKSLGPVTVLKALVNTDKKNEATSSKEIFVFLGDIHAPVMNIPNRTYLRKPPIDNLLWACHRERLVSKQETNKFFDEKTKHFSEEISLELEAKSDEVIAERLKEFLEKNLDSYRIKKWDDDKITKKEAEEWFSNYDKADIFQNAGSDLVTFLQLLLEYQQLSSIPQLQLIQLGDLYDFWIGLNWSFNETLQQSSVFLPQAEKNPPVQSFLDFWRNETLSETSASPAIKFLIDQTKILNPVFVYGNHDNYRATDAWKYEISPANFITTEIWGEHGHQSDTFNQDLYAIIGWTCAQAGFCSYWIRNLEDIMRWISSSVTKTLCQRLIHIRHSACLCQQENKRIYVMGHTHEPLLKRVLVVEQ